MLKPLLNFLNFNSQYPKYQKPMIKQSQLDANLQQNQLELTIPNQSPAVMDLFYCYLKYLH